MTKSSLISFQSIHNYFMKKFLFFANLFVLATFIMCQAQNKPQASSDIIMPNEDQVEEELLITKIIRQYHYRKIPLNDSLSAVILNNYIETLDPGKQYFLASDIKEFDKYKTTLDDDLKSGNLVPAYHIFNIFKRRVLNRNEYIKTALAKEFDFTADEYYNTDKKSLKWATTEQELNENWRKYLKYQTLSLKLTGKKWDEIAKIIKDRYANINKAMAQYNSTDVFQLYLNAFTEAYDPHTSYFSPTSSENFKIEMSQSLEGIGARLQTENDYTKVSEVVLGGPAFKSNLLHKDDKITGVGQGKEGPIVDVVGWRLDEVVKLIRGPKATIVRLQIIPANAPANSLPIEISIVRDKVHLEDAVAKKEVININHNNKNYKIGVIDIPQFYLDFEGAQKKEKGFSSTTADVRRILKELMDEKVDGVVVDLQFNGGGSLSEAIDLTGLFIPDGPVVQVRNSDGSIDVGKDSDPAIVYNGPLVVLINKFSASASEIFAGAIQDYKRGVIVGEQSYGKGTVQNLLDLDRFIANSGSDKKYGQVKLTFAKFYRVTGSSTQHKGVIPDLKLPSIFTGEEYGESSQPSALPWDQISSTSYKPTNYVTKNLVDDLKRKHETRLKTDNDLKKLLDDVAEVDKMRKNTMVSLNEAKRQKEKDAAAKNKTNPLDDLTGNIDNPETEDNKTDKDKPKVINDPYLKEGAKILADMIASIG
jgi:carboxyl-terminal processing protease